MLFGNLLYGFILLVIPAQAGIQFRIYLMRTPLDTGFGSINSPQVAGMRSTN
jgi:hypothetical protein